MRFAYGPQGKLELAFPKSHFEFNLAHSGRWLAFVCAVDYRLGMDIEEVRHVADREAMVRRFFSPEECQEWLSLERSLAARRGCGQGSQPIRVAGDPRSEDFCGLLDFPLNGQ